MTSKLNDLAIASGRHLQSLQTGFIHYYHHSAPEDLHDTIPIYENLLFALALLRSRSGDNIQEAKQLLARLLPFQNHLIASGNFPVYIHEYPVCRDHFHSTHLLLPLYWILKDFSKVLGSELQKNLQDATLSALKHSIGVFENYTPSDWIAIKLASATQAFCSLFQQNLWNLFSATKQDQLHLLPRSETWYTPEILGEILVTFQLIDSDLASKDYDFLRHFLSRIWDQNTGSYIGPAQREYFYKKEPEVTLLDLFMSSWTKQFSQRSLSWSPIHLKASLIQEINTPLSFATVPDTFQEEYWKVYHTSRYAYSLLPKEEGFMNPLHKTYHPLRMLWGDLTKTYSFVCYGNEAKIDYDATQNTTITLLFTLPQTPPDPTQRHKAQEVQFFCSLGGNIFVNQVKATVFHFNDTITVSMGELTFNLTLSLLGGEGEFCGHIMRGNRPSQKASTGQHFDAYDTFIFLRTLGRSNHCRIRAVIEIQEN